MKYDARGRGGCGSIVGSVDVKYDVSGSGGSIVGSVDVKYDARGSGGNGSIVGSVDVKYDVSGRCVQYISASCDDDVCMCGRGSSGGGSSAW